MEITLTIPEDEVNKVAQALGWVALVPNPVHDTMYPDETAATIANPTTKAEHIKKWLCTALCTALAQEELRASQRRIDLGMSESLHIT